MQKVHKLIKTAHAEAWNGCNRLNPDKRGRQLRKIIPHITC